MFVKNRTWALEQKRKTKEWMEEKESDEKPSTLLNEHKIILRRHKFHYTQSCVHILLILCSQWKITFTWGLPRVHAIYYTQQRKFLGKNFHQCSHFMWNESAKLHITLFKLILVFFSLVRFDWNLSMQKCVSVGFYKSENVWIS